MLKLSGEVFGGDGQTIDWERVRRLGAEITAAVSEGLELAIVVGGGNIWRGRTAAEQGMDRASADYAGMVATVINALCLQDVLEAEGLETRTQTAIEMRQVAEPYIPLRAERHMEKGRVVVFGAGAGLPYFSTDTVAAQRALEIRADVLLVAKNGVDGVYTADPNADPEAKLIRRVSYQDALQRGLKVVDSTAFSLCMDNRMDMRVFGMHPEGSIERALRGDDIGTLVSNDVAELEVA